MKYTTLVNKDNKFKENFLNKIELVYTVNINNNPLQLEKETYENYLKLKSFLKDNDIEIGLTGAYRSIEYQTKVYEKSLDENGDEYTKNHVAEPFYSEHHTGLCLDFGVINNGICNSKNLTELEEKQFNFIHKIIHKFGFILRYPKDKENITKYSYEPWHIRYVGEIPATIMYENNLTLEEYLKDFSGVLYINKPKGITSFDVVNEISHSFGIKKVGHTGTLDPLAEGVMLVAIGKATKIVELLTAKDKEYIAGVKLGIKTDTYDITGNILDTKEIPNNINLEETLNSFKKTYLQEVPIYSAVKVDGKKLYEYARNNKSVELPKKEVTIKEIELLNQNNDEFTFRTLVTKGCYIRSLIVDIAESINTYATMTSLKRTKQGLVSIEETSTLDDIKNNDYKIHKIEEVLDYPIIELDEELYFKVSNGVKIPNNYNITDKVIFTHNNKLLGIYIKENNYLKTWKNFN